MPRNRRRNSEHSSTGSVVGGILSVMLFVGLGVGVVILKAQRRAARNDELFGRTESRTDNHGGGGFSAPADHQPANPFPQDSFPQAAPSNPQPKPLAPGLAEAPAVGGFFANNEYREYREDGAILIGFEVGLGKVPDTAVVTYLRPIWLTAAGEQFGTAYGRTNNPVTTVKARDGYAIGGIRVHGGGAMEGICFTFMRRGEKHLIKDDFYISEWCGEQTRKPHQSDLRRGDGQFVIGIFGKRFDDKGGTEFHDSGCIGTLGLTLWVRE